jgi:hypothetical protein
MLTVSPLGREERNWSEGEIKTAQERNRQISLHKNALLSKSCNNTFFFFFNFHKEFRFIPFNIPN